MAGPWEKYQEAEAGPWTKYATAESVAAPAEPKSGLSQAFDVLTAGPRAAGNLVAGAVRGAGSIGATLLAPMDMINSKMEGRPLMEANNQRRADMTAGLQSMGADPSSLAFGAGKLGGEIAGTAGVGGAIARVPGIPAALADAIGTAGMRAGGASGLAGVGTRAAGGAITGGASAGLVNPQDAGTGVLIGGALPPVMAGAGKLGQMAGSALKGSVTPEVATLAKRAKELGIDIPADRLVNSRPLDALAAGLNYTPFSGRAATEARMSTQLNQAASRLMGQDTPNINKALRSAGNALGAKFDDTLRNNGVALDKKLFTDATEIVNRARNELGDDAFRAINYKFQQLMDKGATGTIGGEAAYVIKRDLDRIGRGNSPNAFHALELKGALIEALNRSLGPEKAAAFATTRQQYGNMLALEKLAKNGVEGEISVARLANMGNINNKPLQELADIAAQFVKAREGQHGAAQRAFVGLGVGAMGGPTAFAGGVAAGRGLNSALNSNALSNVMLGGQKSPNALQRLLADQEAQQLMYRTAPLTLGGR